MAIPIPPCRVARVATAIVLGACDRTDSLPQGRAAVDTTRRAPAATTPALAAQARPLPRPHFEDYAARDTALRRRRPAEVRLASAAYGRMYRTTLREAAARGPSFAGHFTLLLWGCGTGCQVASVVDARRGRLSRQTLLTANGAEYRRDSRLLFADPPTPDQPPNCASCGTPAYYEWRDGRFRPVGPGPHPHLGGPRPWSSECGPERHARGRADRAVHVSEMRDVDGRSAVRGARFAEVPRAALRAHLGPRASDCP